MTRPAPTCARMRSTCSSMTFVIVHDGVQPGDVVEEVLENALAVLAVQDLGMELHARQTATAVLEGGHRGTVGLAP